MTLRCQHSPSINGGVTQWGSREKQRVATGGVIVSREWSCECESRVGVVSGVANVSREWES